MKAVLVSVLAIALLMAACKKNADSPDTLLCPIGDSVRKNYSETAMQLMMRRYLADTNMVQYHTATLSQAEKDEVLGYFESIYRLNGPERDSAMDFYRIQALTSAGLYWLDLEVDPGAPEIKTMLAQKKSGNTAFDALLSRYSIDSFKTSYDYPRFNWILAQSRMPFNMIQVAKDLSAFPFIYVAAADGFSFDGNNITLSQHPGYVELDFSVAWGDCPAGCISRHHWVFRVNGCSANFVRSYGQAI